MMESPTMAMMASTRLARAGRQRLIAAATRNVLRANLMLQSSFILGTGSWRGQALADWNSPQPRTRRRGKIQRRPQMADGRMAAKRHKKHKSAKANESIGLVARKRCAVR